MRTVAPSSQTSRCFSAMNCCHTESFSSSKACRPRLTFFGDRKRKHGGWVEEREGVSLLCRLGSGSSWLGCFWVVSLFELLVGYRGILWWLPGVLHVSSHTDTYSLSPPWQFGYAVLEKECQRAGHVEDCGYFFFSKTDSDPSLNIS